jgi:sulfite reductase beta subunit-like hemoprotein
MLRVFVENGDRTNRKKARLKYLIDKWGMPKFVEETEKKLTFKLVHFPLHECEPRHRPFPTDTSASTNRCSAGAAAAARARAKGLSRKTEL